MTFENLLVTVNNHIARVTLNRPPVNALNQEFVRELIRCAQWIKDNDEIWVAAVSANGKAFCAGADLKERAGIPNEQVLQVVQEIQNVTKAWIEIPQPVLMGIHAPALGGGLEFALAGDILAASQTALLGLPETSLGIIPAAGGLHRLAQRCTTGAAKKWILTAQKFSAEEAKNDGVIDYVFSDEKFSSEFETLIATIASNAPLALRQAKKVVESSSKEFLEKGFEQELKLYAPLVTTEDRIEALKAFNEKRKAIWKRK
ncbi:MAG: enoyl-CoA hydratase/isomerase family protein [Bacteroidetes bacterium]|nr:enoyl-CoA hydratase/isomerase family protein [Bacteroidota bacterium]